MLRKCKRGDRAAYLHQARPGAIGHRMYLKGYDRGPNSKVRNNEERGLRDDFRVSCHMTYKPPQADNPES